jgi:DNA-binding XRE family transcriptional regulator
MPPMDNLELKARREAMNLSQSQMAQVLSVSVRTYQGWEAGRPFPAFLELAMCEAERRVKKWQGMAEKRRKEFWRNLSAFMIAPVSDY